MSARDDAAERCGIRADVDSGLRFVADPRAEPAVGMLYDPDDADGCWIRAERSLFVEVGGDE
jgi:hypothetical protein